MSAQSWRSGATGAPRAQADLVLNRADNVVNLCETRWVGSGAAYTIDRSYSLDLARKTEVFASETGTDKAIHTTLVTPGPISRNQYADAVQSVVTAEGLFVP